MNQTFLMDKLKVAGCWFNGLMMLNGCLNFVGVKKQDACHCRVRWTEDTVHVL